VEDAAINLGMAFCGSARSLHLAVGPRKRGVQTECLTALILSCHPSSISGTIEARNDAPVVRIYSPCWYDPEILGLLG